MISNIIRKIITLPSIFYLNKKINIKKNYKILNKINLKIKDNKINYLNLKKTHQIFNKKIYRLLTGNNIQNFLRESFIQKMFFVHNRLFIYNELKLLKEDKKWGLYKKLITEDHIGNPIRYFLYPLSSGNRINHVFHLSILSKEFGINLKEINKIFEFGGGYGCMARIFSKINKSVKYYCFDTFHVNLLQYYYLNHNNLNVGFDERKNNFLLKSDLKSIKSYHKKNLDYLFIANWSLSETPLKFRKNFEGLIKKSKYILICFQEKFEDTDNLKYFKILKKKFSNEFEIKILKNKFYKGNIINPQNHYFFLGKRF